MEKYFEVFSPMHDESAMLLSVPHGGELFPPEFLARTLLPPSRLLASADMGTNRLFDSNKNFWRISQNIARVVVDLNRKRDALDPKLILDVPRNFDPLVLAGFGVIPRFANPHDVVLRGKLPLEEAENWLALYYDPYHQALTEALLRMKDEKGYAVLIDIHSAPESLLKNTDIQIATANGKTMPIFLRDSLGYIAENCGFSVAKEVPFQGGYITQHYAKLSNIYTVQIEINRKHLIKGENHVIKEDLNVLSLKINTILCEFDKKISNFFAI